MAEFKEQPILAEEKNISINHAQHSTTVEEILKEEFHEDKPQVPIEVIATSCSDDIIAERNGNVIRDLVENAQVFDTTLQKTSSNTVIIADENGSDESSREKICSPVNTERANQTNQEDTFCETCLYEDVQTKATHYCKTCDVPEPLCNDCAKQHTRQKLSRDHKLCDDIREFLDHQKCLTSNANQTDQENIYCDPCLYEDIKTKATQFCKTCDAPEPLCNDCAKQHSRQKLSRDHELCNDIQEYLNNQKYLRAKCISDQTDQEDTFCDPCLCGDVKTKAIYYCKTCEVPEPLCNDCAKQHTRQKLNRDHELCDDLQKISDHPKNLRANSDQTHQQGSFCDPCLYGDIQAKATHYCETCDVPEPLCNDCAVQHTRQKSTRDHKLCDDIRELHKNLKNVKANANKSDQHKIFCDPCLYGDIKTEATQYCKTCDVPEPLCNDCAIQHTRQKSSRDHELCNDIRYFPKYQKDFNASIDQTEEEVISCAPCLYGDLKNKATHFCKTCDSPEPLCNDCAQQHTRQKLSRDHELCDDIKVLPTIKIEATKEEVISCAPCLYGNLKNKATHFCKTCDSPEPLCNDCAQQHTRQKLSRDHELCDDIKVLPTIKIDDKTNRKDIFCVPCLYGNLINKATHFCETCDVPEPICTDCAQHHTRQKLSRDHKLCGEIENFSSLLRTLISDQNKNEENVEFCDPCLRKKLKKKQTHFCKTCEVPEALCKDCAQQHTRQKVSRHHEICDATGKSQSVQQRLREEYGSCDDKRPGKPQVTNIKPDSVSLIWEKSCEGVNQYQVRYKPNRENAKWKSTETDSDENHIIVSGLMANTKYTFQVRGIFGDQEGPFGKINENIETTKSLATVLLDFSQLQNKTYSPSIYLLPVEENRNARNKSARTRQLILGTPSSDYHDEKTIMLVGATGSGKSTLVDGIANYIMGVSFEDPFRFTMVTLEEEEKKTHNQAISQTEWITVYKIYPKEGSRLNYTLNIIDTPGFGDTRGIERDNAIVDQIRQLFSAKGDQGVLYIDAVCFIVKAPDARLTVVQKYIFSSIMSLFGKDIESNICTLITFADGAKPPVLASLKESQLPFGLTFSFNSSALFAENKELVHNTLSPMFWKMGCSSFERFFANISRLQTRSLRQTKDVLDEREQLKTVILNIRPQVTAGLSKLSELQQQLDVFKKYKNKIEDNQNFEYEVEETRQEMVDLPKGQHVTNCLQCNITCHEECKIADDEKKRRCSAMDPETGHCRVCTEKCIWSDHKNTPYIFRFVTETVKKTYAEMKERYEEALGHKLTHEKYIEELTYDVEELFDDIMSMMNEMNRCKTRLKEIALRPDPLSAIEHINLMIQSEETDKHPGYFNRVKMLKEIKRMALVDQDVESFGQNIRLTRENIKSITGKTFQKRSLGIVTRVRPRKKNFFARGVQFVKKLL